MCLKDRFQEQPEPSGVVLTVLPLLPYPPVAQSVCGGYKMGGVLGCLAVKLPSAAVKWASFNPHSAGILKRIPFVVDGCCPLLSPSALRAAVSVCLKHQVLPVFDNMPATAWLLPQTTES